MTIHDFISKWRKVELKERSAAQEHFIDLCRVFDHPTPAEADPTGESFCFEKGAARHGGGDGFADVWKRGFSGWEYKGKHKDLTEAYNQLLRYRDALENPPLLVVCDLARIIVHTNFTGTVSSVHEMGLEDLSEPRNLEILRAVFHHPETLRPGNTSTAVTQDAARRFAEIAEAMRGRGLDPAAVAHFLDRLVFCLFAEDTRLLPDMVFSRIVGQSAGDPARFAKLLAQLFDAMATGGDFGLEQIRHFNGNLFDDRSVLDLSPGEIQRIIAAAALDWSAVDPSIFGTLFERGLDPNTRAQLGAHFTGRGDIELVVDAVVLSVLRREWDETRGIIDSLLATGRKTPGPAGTRPLAPAALKKARGEAGSILHRFLDRLQHVKILDPACGSGNFLYVALLRLKDLEKEAILFGGDQGLGSFLPMVGPSQLYGLEINPYAHDLAQMTVWIGWLQWIRANGFGFPADPILRSLSGNIRRMDAILGPDGSEPDWPAVDFIIGNPPFLGDKLMRRELGDDYVDRLRKLYADRIPGQSDLCCYWFEKARAQIAGGHCKRAGLLATQGIRGGANREVLKRIKESGDIFWAESDRVWILDGANVHVSIIAFDNGSDPARVLNGTQVPTINANLTATSDIVSAHSLASNQGFAFIGATKGGSFDIPEHEALLLLRDCPNPHGKPNSDVLKPIMNGQDILQRKETRWVIDFEDFEIGLAQSYEKPYGRVVERVKPSRDTNRNDWLRINWWKLQRIRPEMRVAISGKSRFLSSPRVAKHRIFNWFMWPIITDDQTVVFARSDDLFLGVLHSRFHEIWALAQGTQLREKESGFRYTPTTCFETFPFPPGVVDGAPATAIHEAIAVAAKELNSLRETWLNPPEWTRTEILEFPGTVGGPWDRYIDPATITDRGAFKVGTVRYPRLIPRDADCATRLKTRTLTKLYNERPAWLANAHTKLDTAVATAYGLPPNLSEAEILTHLLALNQAAVR